jgi:molybdopterin adenylyltransferase
MMMNNTEIKVGILTVSDRAFRGEYADISGPAIERWISQAVLSPWTSKIIVVEDEQKKIENALITLSDDKKCNLILTTGGTGPALRDVTPEATQKVCDKILDGFAQQMRTVSLKTVPTAILSRQIAGIRGTSLIVNLPGKPEAIDVCLKAIFLAVPKCLELLDKTNIQIDLNFIEGENE